MNDLALLRQFEPILRFTQGELFFPCGVDEYLRRCSLWLRDDRGGARQLVRVGDLSAEKLGAFGAGPASHALYLRFVDKPLEAVEYQRWLRRPEKPTFRAAGRLTRVGLFARTVVPLLGLSLLVRGQVPGGSSAAAEIKYRDLRRQDPRYFYFGRVIREGGYIILHYLFFYAMNDWRSSFYGANDHEADWEQIFVYLSDEGEDTPVPCWVAYASHDFSGDDLRRRWDDPELHRLDHSHPIVYVGAGSHASYFLPGEYLMGIEPEFMIPVREAITAIRRFWTETMRQGLRGDVEERLGTMLSVPFVDYARGDGRSIGPGQEHEWTPIMLTEEMDWVEDYRGLWGLDTRDPLGGERAPAGPKYNRDGSVRVAWYDPLGWAGLDKVAPPGDMLTQLRQQIADLAKAREEINRDLHQQRQAIRGLDLQAQALQQADYRYWQHMDLRAQLDSAQNELQSLYAQHTDLTESWKASQALLEEVQRGNLGDPQAHIRHKHLPEPSINRQARILELWAAVSGGVALLVFAGLLFLVPSERLAWTVLVVTLFVAIEATVQGRLFQLLLNVTIVLAVVTGLILIKDFLWLIVIVGLSVIVITSTAANIRELSVR